MQDFCQLYTPSSEEGPQEGRSTRQRLLSEQEAAHESSACSVEDVLRLLQLLYAISRDGNIENNLQENAQLNIPSEEFFSKKITNKLVQQTQVGTFYCNMLENVPSVRQTCHRHYHNYNRHTVGSCRLLFTGSTGASQQCHARLVRAANHVVSHALPI